MAKRGGGFAVLELGKEAIRDWRNFDYFALDVTVEEGGPKQLVVELWDGRTKGYPRAAPSRTFASGPGRQTLLYPINRARRNGKEGRSWEELEPQDKIDLGKLTRVKLFLNTRQGSRREPVDRQHPPDAGGRRQAETRPSLARRRDRLQVRLRR